MHFEEVRNEISQEIELIANLGHAYILGKDILSIKTDDVLVLDTKLLNEIEIVTSKGEKKALGRLGFCRNKKIIFIRAIHNDSNSENMHLNQL